MAGMIAQEVERIKRLRIPADPGRIRHQAGRGPQVAESRRMGHLRRFGGLCPEYTVGNRPRRLRAKAGLAQRRFPSRSNAPARTCIDTSSSYWSIAFQEGGKTGRIDQRVDLVALFALASGGLGTETVLDHRTWKPRNPPSWSEGSWTTFPGREWAAARPLATLRTWSSPSREPK